MNKQIQLQQGDVILRRITKIPKNAKVVPHDPRGIVLAEGEVTGHHHRIKHNPKLKLRKIDDLLFLSNESDSPVTLSHEEHEDISIPKGDWKIGRVRRYDYFSKMVRRVED